MTELTPHRSTCQYLIRMHPRIDFHERIFSFIWILCLLYSFVLPVQAQYRFDVWTAENGLPQNVIRNIEQTPDGYLWIATFDGLARFDGARFTVFNKRNTPGLKSNRFGSMYQDSSGDLWLTPEVDGIARYHQGTFRTYGTAQGIPGNIVRSITGDDAGHIWILAGDTIAEWDAVAQRFTGIPQKYPGLHYEPLVWENFGFWGADKTGLHCFIKGRFITYPLPSWLPSQSIWNIASDHSGVLWIEMLDGRHARVTPDGKISGPLSKVTETTYLDSHGHSWTIQIGQRLSRSIKFPSSGRVIPIDFHSIYEDREQNLWIGSEGQGLYRFQQQSIQSYSKEQGLIDRNVYPIYQDRNGAIWIGAWYKGLSRFYQEKFTNSTISDNPRNRLVTAIAEDNRGRLWVATHGGVNVFHDGRFHRSDEPALPNGAVVQVMYLDQKGTLWFGTSKGLVSFKDGLTRFFSKRDGLAGDDVRIITQSSTGDLWIGGYGGLTLLQHDHFVHWVERNGLPDNNIRAICVDSDNVVWIGTYDGGLGRLKDGKFTRYTMRDGLFDNGAFQILEDGHGYLWMSCNRGIYRVSKKELNEFADGRQSIITSISYGKIDGMFNVECNGGLSPAGIRARDGKLWFPTQDGVVVVNPETVRINLQPPPVVIESLMVDHVLTPINGVIQIGTEKENLEIQYTALSFIKSDQIHFKYRLEGLDSSWIDAGQRRIAYYSHIPPGKYSFHVIAGNSDGIWNNEGKILTVTVLASFYQKWWFELLVFLAVVALAMAAWRYRVRQLERAHELQQVFSRQLIESQENERTRIAAELHDSLGQRLIVIKNLTTFLLRSRKKNTSDLEVETLEEISSEAVSAIKEAREISYDLRPFQLDQLGLTNAIEAMIRTVSTASEIKFATELDNVDDLFAEDLRINFYRIVQESLNNVMKHSQATQVSVRIKRSVENITLTIHDNGKGFTLIDKTTHATSKGFGLTNMAERASLLGGDFNLQSAPRQGTTMIVEIALKATHHA